MEGLRTSDYYFDLPQELIAQDPLADRSSSRLLVLAIRTRFMPSLSRCRVSWRKSKMVPL